MLVMKLRVLIISVVVACTTSAAGCSTPSSRIGEYLTGFQTPASQQQALSLPLKVGLLIALPENELSYPTTPSKESLETTGSRIQKDLEESPKIRVERIFPTIIIPAAGLGALSLERVREAAQGTSPKLIVIVATSRPARRVHAWRVEDQLFARMDAALVDLSSGLVLATENGQDDYVLAQSFFYNDFSYPRIYYRTFTFAGPFTVVRQGDPYKALGEAAFSGAADQVGMKLRQKLDPGLSAG
jgi:hypothetical protein